MLIGTGTDPDASEPIDRNLLLLWRLRRGAFVGVAASGTAIGLAVTEGTGPGLASLLFWAPVLAVLWWAAGVEWKAIRFLVGSDTLEIRRGVLLQRTSLIPYHRVQHVDLESGPLERRLGITTLRLRTAAATSDSQVPGIRADRADELRRLVLERVGHGDAV